MHPVITGILERIVPGPGLALPDGRVVPAGTKVGINPWVSSRDRATYGDDADDFRPERWLREAGETEAEYAMRLRRMKDADFTFGGGRRACVGRNMAAVELHKVTATLFSRYNVSCELSRRLSSIRARLLMLNRLSWTVPVSSGPRNGGGSVSWIIFKSKCLCGKPPHWRRKSDEQL